MCFVICIHINRDTITWDIKQILTIVAKNDVFPLLALPISYFSPLSLDLLDNGDEVVVDVCFPSFTTLGGRKRKGSCFATQLPRIGPIFYFCRFLSNGAISDPHRRMPFRAMSFLLCGKSRDRMMMCKQLDVWPFRHRPTPCCGVQFPASFRQAEHFLQMCDGAKT